MIIFYVMCPESPIRWWLYCLGMAEIIAELNLPFMWHCWKMKRAIEQAGREAD